MKGSEKMGTENVVFVGDDEERKTLENISRNSDQK